MAKRYFVTAIGTDSGKTLVSAILTQALHADYWKPIQAGHPRDTDSVMEWVTNGRSVFHREAYLLNHPLSPHAAARLDNVHIHLSDILLPETNKTLIIEGAGGVLVPINDQDFVIDIAAHLEAEIILVSNLYLGSINHTLLTINELKRRGLVVKGIVFNGPENLESQRIIQLHAGYPVLFHLHQEPQITHEVINRYALQVLKSELFGQ